MGDVHGRDPELALDLADLVAERDPDLGIERGQRLIEEQDRRLDGQGPARATRCCWPPDNWYG